MRDNWIRNSKGRWYNLDTMDNLNVNTHARIVFYDRDLKEIDCIFEDKFDEVVDAQDYLDDMMTGKRQTNPEAPLKTWE